MAIWPRSFLILVLAYFSTLTDANSPGKQPCKAIPGSPDWPSESAWNALNETLSGNLIATVPPGAVCHPDQPTYDNATCAVISKLWTTSWDFHSDDPVSVGENNWSNDTCLPYPQYPCSVTGYPVYVVKASKPEYVQAGINFARDNNVRLVVKGTGHDYRGRSIAPYSMSIWTRHLRGLSFDENYQTCQTQPLTSPYVYSGPAITAAAGENLGSVFAFANQRGLMVMAGNADSVGVGGFLTGGGQSLISIEKGIGADAVLEVTIVLPSGEIITANACRNPDIFWAVRGGGGSTVGVVTSFTINAFPSIPITEITFSFLSPTLNDDKFWEAMSYMATQMPVLANSSVTMYAALAVSNQTVSPTFSGTFYGLNQTVARTTAIMLPLAQYINSTFGLDVHSQLTPAQLWDSYYDWWIAHPDTTDTEGLDLAFASRILDEKALNSPNFVTLIQTAAGGTGISFNGVAGPGTHAYPDDFNAATPAWRKGYVHSIIAVAWPPLNETAKAAALASLTYKQSDALRALAPDTGSYLNEANAYELDHQNAFWGSNYPRLLAIKRAVDPEDVFWCQGCAGSERWNVTDAGLLCRI